MIPVDVPTDPAPYVSEWTFSATAGEEVVECSPPASDDDGDVLTYSVTGLPDGATFDPTIHCITWTPTRTQRGTHAFTFTVDDGHQKVSAKGSVDVNGPSGTGVFVPGLAYAVQNGASGVRQGPVVAFDLVDWNDPDHDNGPSQGRVDLAVGVLGDGNGSRELMYGIGTSLALESHAARSFLIPFARAEIDGLYTPNLGNVIAAAPGAGLWLWNDRRVTVDAGCGYVYAFASIATL